MSERAITTVGVVIASAGRPHLVVDIVQSCRAQRGVQFHGVVSVPDEGSLPVDRTILEGWTVLVGVRGAAAQRNVGIDALGDDVAVVCFFDDDAVLREDYLINAMRFFEQNPGVVGMTGRVLLDGKLSGEIAKERAFEALDRSGGESPSAGWRYTRELYGANFAFKLTAAPQMRFDDQLPLYSWLEDHDVARRLLKLGPLAQVDDCVIVHRAAASGGRQNHTRLGYSQVMNAVYLQKKGSFPVWLTAQQILRPFLKNVALSVIASSRGWRRERLRGNFLALADVARGRITPGRIVELEPRGAGTRVGC